MPERGHNVISAAADMRCDLSINPVFACARVRRPMGGDPSQCQKQSRETAFRAEGGRGSRP